MPARPPGLAPRACSSNPPSPYADRISAADTAEPQELIVAPDGSIPAEQLARLGLRPGAHLRVVPEPAPQHRALRGSLPDFPALTWDDFERGSQLARSDLNPR